jgi:hypothetical protein
MGHRAYQLNYTHDEDGVGYWEALYSHNGALLAFDDTLPSDLDDVIPLPCEPTTYKSSYTSRCVKPTGERSDDRFEKMHDLDSMIRHMGSAALQEVLWVNYGLTRGYSTYLPVRILWPHEIKDYLRMSWEEEDDASLDFTMNPSFNKWLEDIEGQLGFFIQADKQRDFIEAKELLTNDLMYTMYKKRWESIVEEGLEWIKKNRQDKSAFLDDAKMLVSFWLYEMSDWWLNELAKLEKLDVLANHMPSFSPVRWESEPFSEEWNALGIVNQGWLRTDGEIIGMKKVIPAEIIRNLPKRYLEGKR